MTAITLKGMTWSHPRGFDPMVACSAEWQKRTGVIIDWDKRSLQDFESFPVEELAREYDLIVIDHPHVGQITDEGCLAPLDQPDRREAFDAMRAATVGQSFDSYHWQGRQWAFPIDAAAQVEAYRADLTDAATSWNAVMQLARDGKVLLALRPPHSLMTFYTLCANLGSPCSSVLSDALVDQDMGEKAFSMLADLASMVDPACFDMDPIAISERMAAEGSTIACSPYIYGYVNYAIKGFRPNRLTFCDIPTAGNEGCTGSALGGTGIAVSAMSKNREAAIEFAYWVASGEVQQNLYASAGGQPGHRHGWLDNEVNATTGDFYRNTLKTLDKAWIRPRHNGYMVFQQAASDRINRGLKKGERSATVVADLNRMFAESGS